MFKLKYINLLFVLILIAGVCEAMVYLNYNELTARPMVINKFLEISPVYNEDGSWFHAKLGIGYIRWLLIAESVMVLLIDFWGFRYVEAMSRFLNITSFWLYGIIFGMANVVYRLFTHIRGVFTLDYLHIKSGSTYDIPDFYLLVLCITAFIWMIPCLIAYYKYRNKKVKGMAFLQKLIWELKLTAMLLKAPILPENKWQAMFDQWK